MVGGEQVVLELHVVQPLIGESGEGVAVFGRRRRT